MKGQKSWNQDGTYAWRNLKQQAVLGEMLLQGQSSKIIRLQSSKLGHTMSGVEIIWLTGFL